MALETVSILDGNEFVVSDRRGDLEATPTDNHGLFLDDTRFLSRWVLTINGQRPTLLSVDDTSYYRVQYFLALATGTVYIDSQLSVVRQRSVHGGFHERSWRSRTTAQRRSTSTSASRRAPTSPTCSRSRRSAPRRASSIAKSPTIG